MFRNYPSMKPSFVKYSRYFFAGAIAASMLAEVIGLSNIFANLGISSAAGIGTLVLAKKFALIV